jgi:hypothetical protein
MCTSCITVFPYISLFVNVEAMFSLREPGDGTLNLDAVVGFGERHPPIDGVGFENHHALVYLE